MTHRPMFSRPGSVLAFLVGLASAGIATTAPAIGLMQVYELALENDQQYLSAEATSLAAKEAEPQARAGLLPNVAFNASIDRTREDIKFGGPDGSFTGNSVDLSITQPVYRFDRFIALGQAKTQVVRADIDFAFSRQDLMVRVSERYFGVLKALDTLEFAMSEKEAFNQQLKQAQQRFEVGLIAITDVHEAQAGFDLAVANEIAAVNAVDTASEALREITGQYLTGLAALSGKLTLVTPEPPDIDAWTKIALEQNLQLESANQTVKIASAEIRRIRAGHLPTLDLVGRLSRATTGIDRESDDASISLQLNVPIYTGGIVVSRTREARRLFERATADYAFVQRTTQRQTRDAFLGVQSGISRVRALAQAIVSTTSALEAVEAGFQVGTRTTVDVLQAQRALTESRRNYSAARYDYLLDIVRLKQAAGTLAEPDIDRIGGWLK